MIAMKLMLIVKAMTTTTKSNLIAFVLLIFHPAQFDIPTGSLAKWTTSPCREP